MFRQVADIQTAQMLKLPVPALENEKATIVNAPATPQLKRFVTALATRAEKLKTGRVDPARTTCSKSRWRAGKPRLICGSWIITPVIRSRAK